MQLYPSVEAFMVGVVEPLRQSSPAHVRLDGETAGGNRETVGTFRHAGRRWKVHADTHYAPLEIAFRAVKRDGTIDPFVEEHTASGKCLVLRPDLRTEYKSRHKHLYIYELTT